MGVMEWISFGGLFIIIIGAILRVYSDFAKVERDIASLNKWKDKMEGTDFLTVTAHSREKTDCRQEIYKDITRLETRFDRVLETMASNEAERRKSEEAIKSEIRGMRDSLIKALTYLEQKGD